MTTAKPLRRNSISTAFSTQESMFNDSMNTKSERDTPIQQGFDDFYIGVFVY
jgi:hypothetical protein